MRDLGERLIELNGVFGKKFEWVKKLINRTDLQGF